MKQFILLQINIEVIPKDIINDNNLIEPYKLKVNQFLFLRIKIFMSLRKVTL